MKELNDKVLLLPEYNLELSFDIQPAVSEPWKLVQREKLEPHGERRIFQAGEYYLDVLKENHKIHTSFDFAIRRLDNQVFNIKKYVIECLVPVIDMYNVSPRFMGYAHVNHLNPPTLISSCTSKDFPFVLYGSRNGENRFVIGLENQIIETEITRHGKGGYMYYDTNLIRFSRPASGGTITCRKHRDGIFVSNVPQSWFHVTREYWDWIDRKRNYQPNPTPPSAYGPVWCSWLYLTDIDEKKIWDNARVAKELGIKTIIIDAGWFCSDTDIPFPDSPLTRETLGFGRIDADKRKFPDMAGLVKRIQQELGLYVWGWVTPRWVFTAIEEGEGAVDQQLLDCRIVTPQGVTVPILCTRNPQAREHAAKLTRYLLETYGFDGLKFDCWEYEGDMDICTASHEHTHDTMGEGTVEWARGIYESMTQFNPNAVVWLNNTTLKPFSNYSVSPNEIYCHPDENWRMSVVLKTFTRGIVSQLCEGSWNPEELDKNVARHMAILMMGHTPEVQVDLTQLRESHKRIVKEWLAFYWEHKDALHGGDYEPFGFENLLGGPISTTPPNVKIEGHGKAFVWLGPAYPENIELQEKPRMVYLFNLRNTQGISVRLHGLPIGNVKVKINNIYLETVAEQHIFCNGSLQLDEAIPEGGMISIQFIDNKSDL